MRHHYEGYQQTVRRKAYMDEVTEFKKTLSLIYKLALPPNSNVIFSHAIYKVKFNEENILKFNDRIAPHGSEKSIKSN